MSKCLNPNCQNPAKNRGLCHWCYNVACRLVKVQKSSWEILITEGKALPAAKRGRPGTRNTQKWLLEKKVDFPGMKPGEKQKVNMHYRNGRTAQNGDKVVVIPTYGAPVIGILYDATPGNDYCNGKIAPVSPNDPCPNLNECLHLDDVLGAVKESPLTKLPEPVAPPANNEHVADGCEKFAEPKKA